MENYVYVLVRDAHDLVGVFENKDDAMEHREVDIMQQADHGLLYQLSDYKVKLVPFYKARQVLRTGQDWFRDAYEYGLKVDR